MTLKIHNETDRSEFQASLSSRQRLTVWPFIIFYVALMVTRLPDLTDALKSEKDQRQLEIAMRFLVEVPILLVIYAIFDLRKNQRLFDIVLCVAYVWRACTMTALCRILLNQGLFVPTRPEAFLPPGLFFFLMMLNIKTHNAVIVNLTTYAVFIVTYVVHIKMVGTPYREKTCS